MGYLSRIVVCLVLVVISLGANTQEIPKSQQDQSSISAADMATQKRPETPRITNTGTGNTNHTNGMPGATDQGMQFRQQPGLSNRDPQPQESPSSSASRPRITQNNEFQKFVFEATGKQLTIYGSEFFDSNPSTFAPLQNTPIPTEYTLGPGDELLIRGWGTIDIDYRTTIDRNGLIALPTIGTIVLGGVKAGEAENVIRAAVGRLYKGVTLSLTFGKLRAITIYVVGQANRPGTYTVSSLSTLVTALFASGGPNPNGSLRSVQVKRAGKVMAEMDLYAFIAKGDKSSDIKLQDGDTIYIPPARGFVAVTGKVNSPGVYELRSASDTVSSLLDFAGGLPIVADPRRVYLERIDPQNARPRMVEEFALNTIGLAKTLKSGDLLTITPIVSEFGNAVTLRGNVTQLIRTSFKPGMRVSDLIPNREYLITRASVQRQNAVMLPDQDKQFRNNTEMGTTPNNGDQLTAREPKTRQNNLTALQGNSNDKEFSSESESIAANIGNLMDEINWDYAVIERINRKDLSVTILPFNLGKMLDNPIGPDNIALQPGDIVTTFSQNDVLVPIEKRRVLVRVEGEVNVPGVYQMNPSETIVDLISRAGGPTSNAYIFGTEFYREQVRRAQQANMAKVIHKMETQAQSAQVRAVANTTGQSVSDAQLAELKRQTELGARQEALTRLRELKPTGRVSFGLNPKERSFNRLPALKLQNGDQLIIPSRPDFVHVYGAVDQEASLLWKPGMTLKRYLNNVGPTTSADMEALFVLRADGSVLSANSESRFFGSIANLEIMPGDTIVVPEKVSAETGWTRFMGGLKDWSQVLANFGLGAAAIQVLR